MDTHSTMDTHYPKSLRIESLLRVVRRFVLAAVILPTFTAVPALLADTAPSFTSANSVTFPQGIRDYLHYYDHWHSGPEDYLERPPAWRGKICR